MICSCILSTSRDSNVFHADDSVKLHDDHIRLNDDSTFELQDEEKFRSMSRVVVSKKNSVVNKISRAENSSEKYEKKMRIMRTLNYDVETQIQDCI